jgi:hypothetical protein
VTDSLGHVAGIGSRYFRIPDTAGITTAAAQPLGRTVAGGVAMEAVPVVDVRAARDLGTTVWMRRGPDPTTRLEPVEERHGARLVAAQQLERVELHLAGAGVPAGSVFDGHLLVNGMLRPLPIGSTLDRRRGVFFWQPGVGFLGRYPLVFTRAVGGRLVEQIPVTVVLEPVMRSVSDVQLAIDLPRPGTVAVPFTVAGWALDRGARDGPRIDAIHVWAYPVTPAGFGTPTFLGAAALGGWRPDVATTFGARFGASGYGLTVSRLTPGRYAIAVFPHSTVTAEFAPARVVYVTVR